jgi:adenylate cyclase
MLSPKAKRNISRIIPFGIIWFFTALVFFIVEKAAFGDTGSPSTGIDISFEIFIFGMFVITCLGLLVGAIEIFYMDKAFAKLSFSKKIFYKIIIYLLMLFVVTIITFPIAASLELNTTIFDSKVWDKLFLYLTSFTHLSTDLQSTVSLALSIFYFEISENIGHGILINFFTGKYHSPKVEKRIFMFTDMKSSTAIAENLGHIKYFELLKVYYNDLSDAIINHSGEIYQYIGDEIVVSWKFKEGINNNNCIKCFFAMKDDLRKREKWYLDEFGIFPNFKAGFHFGQVTAGEIGALKKEIIFTGDVLNSTARIQELCNNYKVDILVSDDLLKSINLESEFHVKSLGKNELRGKTKDIELYTIVKD